MLSLPKQSPIQHLLYKTITCLTRPATTFFVCHMKKNCLKQPPQFFSLQETMCFWNTVEHLLPVLLALGWA